MEEEALEIRGSGVIEKDRRRPNTWKVTFYLGKKDSKGRYMRAPKRTIHGSKADARAAVSAYIAEYEAAHDPTNQLITTYALNFHALRKDDPGVKKLTYEREGREIADVADIYGHFRVKDITPADIRQAESDARASGFYTENRLHHAHAKLRQVLNDAYLNEIIPTNPADKVKFKRPAPTQERRSLTPEEAKRLFALAVGDGTAYGLALMLLIATGMRRGEALGLTWRHVDFESDSIYVAQQLTKYCELDSPKTAKSKRWLCIRGFTADRLYQWRQEQARLLSELGMPQTLDTPVFTNEIGGFIDPNNYSRWWRNFSVDNGFGRFTKKLRTGQMNGKEITRGEGYEGIKLHELRHTQATLLQRKVSPKAAQHRLGHAQLSMTMNTYAHALDSEELEVALAIDELLADGYASSGRDLSTMMPIEVAVETPLVVKPVGPKYPNGPRSGVEAEAAVRKYAQSQMGEFTKREAMEACEISSQKWMSNALAKLQREGVIKKLGTSKDARYRTLKAS